MATELKKILFIDKTNWTLVKFGDVAFEPKENAKDIYSEGIKHVVGLEHIDSENIHLKRSRELEDTTTFSKKFKKGDVLFGRRRAYLRKAALASFEGICSGDITIFRTKKNLMPELLPFITNNEKFFDHAIMHSAGGLSPRVKFKDLANYEFFLPPKDQQAKLADLIWAIDDVIEKEKEVLERLEKLYKSKIGKSFPRKFEFYWQLSKSINTRKGITYKSTDYSDKENGIPLLNLKSIERGGGFNNDGIKYYDGDYKESQFVRDEDLIIACTDITRDGNVVGFPLQPEVYQNKQMLFTMDLVAIEITDKSLSRDYLYYALKTDWIHWILFANSPGTTVLHLDLNGLNRIKIPKVPIQEQLSIVQELKKIENSIKTVQSKITCSEALLKSLINQIF